MLSNIVIMLVYVIYTYLKFKINNILYASIVGLELPSLWVFFNIIGPILFLN